ncbi:hypothetical protein Q7P37_000118 [Cladosporium fusiforme]
MNPAARTLCYLLPAGGTSRPVELERPTAAGPGWLDGDDGWRCTRSDDAFLVPMEIEPRFALARLMSALVAADVADTDDTDDAAVLRLVSFWQ